jgi:hypothetical protein
MGKYLHLFDKQSDLEVNKDKITPPWISLVKENNKMGMHTDKDANKMFNTQRKSVNITENGKVTILPDENYGSLSSVDINVNISGSDTSMPTYTGHADVDGLRAIGWTDEDIAYYQSNGVNWNEEDDQYHLVSDDNKALYGVLNANNISSYRDRIVYLPKIDLSIPGLGPVNLEYLFENCYNLVAIPKLDTSGNTRVNSTFQLCYSLQCIPPLDFSNVKSFRYPFYYCHSLTNIPYLNIGNATDIDGLFDNCNPVGEVCIDVRSVSNLSYTFTGCKSITSLKLKNLKTSCNLSALKALDKSGLIYTINNEAATSAITITLSSCAYDRLANDTDVVAALANHPNISLAK